MNQFKIVLKSIRLFGHHGVLPEEQVKGQNFNIDVKYKFSKKEAADDIDATVDYSKVFSVVKQTFEAKRYNLLENLSQDIAEAILSGFSAINKVKVIVWKANPPVGADMEAVAVFSTAKR